MGGRGIPRTALRLAIPWKDSQSALNPVPFMAMVQDSEQTQLSVSQGTGSRRVRALQAVPGPGLWTALPLAASRCGDAHSVLPTREAHPNTGPQVLGSGTWPRPSTRHRPSVPSHSGGHADTVWPRPQANKAVPPGRTLQRPRDQGRGGAPLRAAATGNRRGALSAAVRGWGAAGRGPERAAPSSAPSARGGTRLADSPTAALIYSSGVKRDGSA